VSNEEYQQIVEDCINRESKLTDWERGFISNINDTLDADDGLSATQAEILEGIWERIT
jgi:hypothetical protein